MDPLCRTQHPIRTGNPFPPRRRYDRWLSGDRRSVRTARAAPQGAKPFT